MLSAIVELKKKINYLIHCHGFQGSLVTKCAWDIKCETWWFECLHPQKHKSWNCGCRFTIISHNLTSSCRSLSLTSLRAIFPSAQRVAKKNSWEDWPGVSWVGAQGLIMESVSHKQNSVNSRFRLKCVKGIRGKSGDVLWLLFALLSDHMPRLFLTPTGPRWWGKPWSGKQYWKKWQKKCDVGLV